MLKTLGLAALKLPQTANDGGQNPNPLRHIHRKPYFMSIGGVVNALKDALPEGPRWIRPGR